jgi:isochorismate hydrolase
MMERFTMSNQPKIMLCIVDVQEKLFLAMPEGVREDYIKNIANLKWMFEQLGFPILVTEQYPKGLGSTVSGLQPVEALDKMTFSIAQDEKIVQKITEVNPEQVVLCGMETHICVAQSCRDLSSAGIHVWVVADGCLSRKKEDWKFGLQRMVVDGGRLITTESVLFEIIETAEHPLFKEISKRVR